MTNGFRAVVSWLQQTPLMSAFGIFITMIIVCLGDLHPVVRSSGASREIHPWIDRHGMELNIAISGCITLLGVFTWFHDKARKRAQRRHKRRTFLVKLTARLATPEWICIAAAVLLFWVPWALVAILSVYILMREPVGDNLIADGTAKMLRALLIVGAAVLTGFDLWLIWRGQVLTMPSADFETHLIAFVLGMYSTMFVWGLLAVQSMRGTSR